MIVSRGTRHLTVEVMHRMTRWVIYLIPADLTSSEWIRTRESGTSGSVYRWHVRWVCELIGDGSGRCQHPPIYIPTKGSWNRDVNLLEGHLVTVGGGKWWINVETGVRDIPESSDHKTRWNGSKLMPNSQFKHIWRNFLEYPWYFRYCSYFSIRDIFMIYNK